MSASNSHFKDLTEFHKTFECPAPDDFDIDYFKKKDLVKLRMDLIREEVQELEDAVKAEDFKETIDALTDILYVVVGKAVCMGIDIKKAFDIVHHSNMSKACRTEEEAKETVKWYKENKLDIYDSPNYKKSIDGRYFIVFNESTGKILKNINYTPANFKNILK